MGALTTRCRLPRLRRRENVAAAQHQELRVRASLHGYRAGQRFRKSRYRYWRSEFGKCSALIAHIYGLTEQEFAHILSTFPLVPQETKDAALAEFRKM